MRSLVAAAVERAMKRQRSDLARLEWGLDIGASCRHPRHRSPQPAALACPLWGRSAQRLAPPSAPARHCMATPSRVTVPSRSDSVATAP